MSDEVPGDERALLRAAVAAWNSGRWRAAHDGFEELWRASSGAQAGAENARSAPAAHKGDAVHDDMHEADARAEAARVGGDPRPELWRALAQAAAVGVLWRQGRVNGARAVASKAAARLRVLRDEHGGRLEGLDLEDAARNLAACVEDAALLGPLRVLEPEG